MTVGPHWPRRPDGRVQFRQPDVRASAVLRHHVLPVRLSIARIRTAREPLVPGCAQMPGVIASPQTRCFGIASIRTSADATAGHATIEPNATTNARTRRIARAYGQTGARPPRINPERSELDAKIDAAR